MLKSFLLVNVAAVEELSGRYCGGKVEELSVSQCKVSVGHCGGKVSVGYCGGEVQNFSVVNVAVKLNSFL